MKNSMIRPALLSLGLVAAFALVAGSATAKSPKAKDGKRGERPGMFERMDLNKDGKVTKAEAKKLADKRFKEMDANKDGSIVEKEAKAFHEKKRAEHKAKRSSDKDSKARRGGEHKRRGHGPGHLLKKADANEDGKVTRAEMRKVETKRFARTDKNGDGVITKAEARAAHKNRRGACGNKRGQKARGGKRA